MTASGLRHRLLPFLLPLFMALTVAVYWSGLYGGYTFDDYPNIVDNSALRPAHIDLKSLIADDTALAAFIVAFRQAYPHATESTGVPDGQTIH